MLLKGFKPIIFTRVSRILIARPLFNQRMQCKTNSWYCCLCYPSDSLNSTFNVWCFLLLSSIWPLVSVIACMIRCKALVPHDIIRAEMRAASIIIEALFRLVTCIKQLWGSLKEVTEGWHLHHQNNLRNKHGTNINALPLFEYSLDSPHLNMTKVEKNRVIQTNIINFKNKITWISPKISLGRKMAHYRGHFLHTSEDGFIIRPSMWIYIYSMRCTLW